jgi:hypothetical protein
MMLVTPQIGRTPPASIDAACVWPALPIAAGATPRNLRPASCLAMAKRMAFTEAGSLELARRCLLDLALAVGSGAMATLPTMEAAAPVAIAMADPLTAA